MQQQFSSMPSPDASLATWAEWYALAGFPIFPCQGKKPLTGHGFQDASSDIFTVAMWWRQYPQANIGLATGHDCWVMDEDPRHGGDAALQALVHQYGPLPDSARVLSGGADHGVHHYFVPPDDGRTVRNKAKIGEGLDIQALGAYVILPPSIHPETGRAYQWDLGADLEDPGISPAPEWLLGLVTRNGDPAQQSTGAPSLTPGAPIAEGTRESTLVRIGAAMRHAGADYQEILTALDAANRRCVPPLPAIDLERVARSVTRYEIDAVFERPAGGMQGTPGELQWGTEQKAPTPPELLDMADLLVRDYPLPRWLIKGLIPEGLTFFAGSPKSSKTYLAYSLALSLAFQTANNGLWLDQYDLKMTGPVVYITLEDDEADSKQRILELMPSLKTVPPNKFLLHHGVDIPQLGLGLTEWLEEFIVKPYAPALVVLDPISYLYAPQKKNGDQFTEVRTMLLPLRTMARTYHFSVIGVDHRRKKAADDVDIFETLYGSNAKIAIADSLLLIVRDDKEITIHAKVRKGADQTLTLDFQFDSDGAAHWTWKGSSDGLTSQGQYGDLRQKILMVLAQLKRPLSIREILMECDIPDSRAMRKAIDSALYRAQKAGEVQKTDRGHYVWNAKTED